MFGLFKQNKTCSTSGPQKTRLNDYDDPAVIASYFQQKTGVSFEKQNSILKSKLSSFCILRDINSFDLCLQQIKVDKSLEQELIDYLTTNETYFYREFSQIEQLVNKIKLRNDEVNIICAPCSTGEESYSIVIALLEAGISSDRFKLLGIDINQTALDKAKVGHYSGRNVSKMPSQLVSKYFDKNGNKYLLKAPVKARVKFKLLNLFDPAISQIGQFDYVLSRNMLIYFNQPTKHKAREVLEGLLKDKGQQVLYGHADLY